VAALLSFLCDRSFLFCGAPAKKLLRLDEHATVQMGCVWTEQCPYRDVGGVVRDSLKELVTESSDTFIVSVSASHVP